MPGKGKGKKLDKSPAVFLLADLNRRLEPLIRDSVKKEIGDAWKLTEDDIREAHGHLLKDELEKKVAAESRKDEKADNK